MRDGLKRDDLAAELLHWYDHNARDLPWRTSPADRKAGITPDPYRVWLSEIMLQQTTVAAVKSYFERFTSLWPTVGDLAAAADEVVMGEWAGLGYYARARNLLKCARVVSQEFGGVFPTDRKTLLSLPGIGPYTASAIASIAFDQPETVVDGNVERVMSRLYLVETPLPTSKPELTEHAADLTPQSRPGDYAQAVMDLGATICTPKSPACGICPWREPCAARVAGIAAELPRKLPKKAKPVRLGHVLVARDENGDWIVERRPDKGLLGGMLGWPGSEWSETPPDLPEHPDYRDIGEVRHTFTHFHLILRVYVAEGVKTLPDGAFSHSKTEFRPSDLPTVMRKAFDLARTTFEN